MEPTRNNKGVKHENGAIESPHRHLKAKIDQKLRLRGSRDFGSMEEYRAFVAEIVRKQNERCSAKLSEERRHLRPLPSFRTRDYEVESVPVPSTGVINVRQAYYSVPSRLVGSMLTVHLRDDRLECFVGDALTITLERLRWKGKGHRPRKIDYRHIMPELTRKPQAFRHYVFRDDLFPSDEFREAWQWLDSHLDGRNACREIVKVLKLAADGHEERIAAELRKHLMRQQMPKAEDLAKEMTVTPAAVPIVQIVNQDLKSYDRLLESVNQVNQ